ncbi:phosphoribosylformylglycinamidine synthase subunit PurL [Candidatus Pacearchaeota archaeon]|nr:phosphoribosylformylglycinamidine synthase subunit PurL [Candidatus Pacearchaeota archaeon]
MSKDIINKLRDAMSSEHCSYKSTKKFLSKLHTKAPWVIQGPGENAGIVDIGDGLALALRIESHNHPSYISPHHGAATGVGGILRDIFTMGARPIALLDFLRFGTDKKAGNLLEEVVRGISDYGNCVGIPVVGGDLYLDKTYNKNCLVNVCALGLVKKENIIYGHALTPGNDLIYAGARTGKDGIGGAEMASSNLEILDASKVQNPDPYLEKLLLEACCELSEKKLVEGMQDMGAAGLLCSTTEVALRGQKKTGRNIGTKIDLLKIPLKSKGMSPEEILLSESQERMLIVGKKEFRNQILNIFKKWDLEAEIIGEVTEDGKYTLSYKNNEAPIDLEINFAEIMPDLEENWPLYDWPSQKTKHEKGSGKLIRNIWQQYDWGVGARTIKGPNLSGNYAILDIYEIEKELVVSWSSDEGRSDLNAKEGAKYAFNRCYEKMREHKAAPLAITNCLNFGHPKDSMGAFNETIEGLKEICKEKNVPVISGNVSLYNACKEHSIKPTPIIVMIGIRDKS